MDVAAFDEMATSCPGVRCRSARGPARWELRGRLIGRKPDPATAVTDALTSAWRPRTGVVTGGEHA